jgi:hypothetical protein
MQQFAHSQSCRSDNFDLVLYIRPECLFLILINFKFILLKLFQLLEGFIQSNAIKNNLKH